MRELTQDGSIQRISYTLSIVHTHNIKHGEFSGSAEARSAMQSCKTRKITLTSKQHDFSLQVQNLFDHNHSTPLNVAL